MRAAGEGEGLKGCGWSAVQGHLLKQQPALRVHVLNTIRWLECEGEKEVGGLQHRVMNSNRNQRLEYWVPQK